jgi:hypothetical protein
MEWQNANRLQVAAQCRADERVGHDADDHGLASILPLVRAHHDPRAFDQQHDEHALCRQVERTEEWKQ